MCVCFGRVGAVAREKYGTLRWYEDGGSVNYMSRSGKIYWWSNGGQKWQVQQDQTAAWFSALPETTAAQLAKKTGRPGLVQTLGLAAAAKDASKDAPKESASGVGKKEEADATIRTPVRIPLAEHGITAKDVKCGDNHTIVLDVDGAVYTCGGNVDGQLGRTDDATCIPDTTFSRILLPPGEKIASVAAGANHTLLLSHRGTVYSFGDNSVNQLGRLCNDGGEAKNRPGLVKDVHESTRTITCVAASGDNSFVCFSHPPVPKGVNAMACYATTSRPAVDAESTQRSLPPLAMHMVFGTESMSVASFDITSGELYTHCSSTVSADAPVTQRGKR